MTGTIRRQDLQSPDTIVVLELDGSAEEIVPVEERILTADAKVSTSSTCDRQEYGPERTLDGNRKTYWTTDKGVMEGWLEYDLGEPRNSSIPSNVGGVVVNV